MYRLIAIFTRPGEVVLDCFNGAGTTRALRLLDARSVGGIIDRGGTVLGTSRCTRLKSEAGQLAAVNQMRTLRLDTLIVIGGNGSHEGAYKLTQHGTHVIAVASTIDNDLPSCDITIGATTALDTAVQAIDRCL